MDIIPIHFFRCLICRIILNKKMKEHFDRDHEEYADKWEQYCEQIEFDLPETTLKCDKLGCHESFHGSRLEAWERMHLHIWKDHIVAAADTQSAGQGEDPDKLQDQELDDNDDDDGDEPGQCDDTMREAPWIQRQPQQGFDLYRSQARRGGFDHVTQPTEAFVEQIHYQEKDQRTDTGGHYRDVQARARIPPVPPRSDMVFDGDFTSLGEGATELIKPRNVEYATPYVALDFDLDLDHFNQDTLPAAIWPETVTHYDDLAGRDDFHYAADTGDSAEPDDKGPSTFTKKPGTQNTQRLPPLPIR